MTIGNLNIIKNTILNIEATVNPGHNQTVNEFHWKLNGIRMEWNSYIISLDTSTMNNGLHVLMFEATNSCGKTGNAQLQFNIIEVTNMEKSVTVLVNQPIVQAAIVMDYVGTIETTVTDGVNPVAGASMELDATATGIVTGVDGKASIPNVPYGTHTVKAVKV